MVVTSDGGGLYGVGMEASHNTACTVCSLWMTPVSTAPHGGTYNLEFDKIISIPEIFIMFQQFN